jgi:glycosyl transferase, family 25
LEEDMNKFFDHIFCVNLDRRPDKWEECVKEFDKWGLEVERFSAVDGNTIEPFNYKVPRGSIGNCLSKIGVLKLSKERKYKSVLVLEDDVAFQDDFNNKFAEWSKEVPENWDMLWIGGNHNWVKNIPLFSPHLIRITNTYATHAFALRDTVYDRVLDRLVPLEPQDDIILAELQKECEAFCFMPNLAYQRAGMSDVFNRYVDYDFLKTGKW